MIIYLISIDYTKVYYLPPATEGCGQEIIKYILSHSLCVCAFMSCFHINLYISFIYGKDIFTKFVRDVYGWKSISVQNFGFILKNNTVAIALCLKIIKML